MGGVWHNDNKRFPTGLHGAQMNRIIQARNDPQVARAYWNMGRGDNDRLFRAARRHSRHVRIMRLAIPVGVCLLLGGAVLASYLNPLSVLDKMPVDMKNLVVSGTRITMESP